MITNTFPMLGFQYWSNNEKNICNQYWLPVRNDNLTNIGNQCCPNIGNQYFSINIDSILGTNIKSILITIINPTLGFKYFSNNDNQYLPNTGCPTLNPYWEQIFGQHWYPLLTQHWVSNIYTLSGTFFSNFESIQIVSININCTNYLLRVQNDSITNIGI